MQISKREKVQVQKTFFSIIFFKNVFSFFLAEVTLRASLYISQKFHTDGLSHV